MAMNAALPDRLRLEVHGEDYRVYGPDNELVMCDYPYYPDAPERELAEEMVRRYNRPQLTVWFGAMPESNGKANWSAFLYRPGQFMDGFQFARSEHHDRVRYDADRMRHLIGELEKEPDILAYDPDMLSPAGWQHPSAALRNAGGE